MSRYVSGSILPSSEPRILQPIETPFGVLQVKVLPDFDCHGLFITQDYGPQLVAMHGNGYSCHNLAERMVQGDPDRIRQQAKYIRDCGGMTRSLDSFVRMTEWRKPRLRPARNKAA